MKAQLQMLAAYNAWVNERLCGAAAKLSDEDYRSDSKWETTRALLAKLEQIPIIWTRSRHV